MNTKKTLSLSLLLLALFALGVPVLAQDEGKDDARTPAKLQVMPAIELGSRGYLGVELTSLTPELRRHFGAPEGLGVMIGSVADDSPAAKAGLEVGDVVTRFGGEDVTSTWDLGRLVRARETDEVVDLELYRDGRLETLSVTIEERKRSAFDVTPIFTGELEALPEWFRERLPQGVQSLRFERLPDVDKLVERIDAERLDEVMERLNERLQSEDWQKRFEQLQKIDMQEVEKRLEEVTRRLQALEVEIEKEREKNPEDGDL